MDRRTSPINVNQALVPKLFKCWPMASGRSVGYVHMELLIRLCRMIIE
jgi:hypothetical protein